MLAEDFLLQIPIPMSRIPTLSNELSPWPRIQIGEVASNATTVNQRITLPRLHRDSSQRSHGISGAAQPRERASSDVAGVPAKYQPRGRSTSFGSTQEFQGTYSSVPLQRLDRKVSDHKVQELLKLRNRKLKEAERKGNEVEVFRLKNLNVFDEIERPESCEEVPKQLHFAGAFTEQTHHQGLTSQVGVIDFGFACQSGLVNQGHAATLCWHLKLEFTQGLKVPDEFSQCTIHPTPSPSASSRPSFTDQSTSQSSLSAVSKRSLRRTKISSIGSSTLRGSWKRSSPASAATCSPTAIVSEPSSPTEVSLTVPYSDDEDLFLYIAKCVKRRTEGNNELKRVEATGLQASGTEGKRSFHNKCTCTGHNCRTYLSGPPSKHCRFCKLPRPQPEIVVAVDRVEETKLSLLVRADANLPRRQSSEAREFEKFEGLQEDMKLVEMYHAETEKRCRNGVWWEGWLVVEDLKRQGIVGSKPRIHAGNDTVA